MRKIKILVVEDDAIVSKDINKTLHNLGYSVTSIVPAGKEAFIKVGGDNPDLVRMDIVLKGELSGIETARKIYDRFNIPIVYITSYLDEKIMEAAKITNPFGYILKPIDEKKLRINIEIALYKHTREKKLEQALCDSERRYSQLVNHMNEGVVVQDENSIITYVNERFLEMSGYTKEEIIGYSPTKFLDEIQLEYFKRQRTRRKKGISNTCKMEGNRKNGQRVLMNVSSAPIYDEDNSKGIIAMLTDVAEFRQIEKKLNRSQKELHNLYRHLHSIREKESKRIAREIHDELGQILTALKMDIFWLANKLSNSHKDQKLFLEKIKSMSKLIDVTIKTVQKIASDLRPGILDDLGLVPAIEWQAQDFQNRTKIKCKTDLDSNGVELTPDCSTAIFRIFQEALTNVARHDEATRVNASLRRKNGKLEMRIRDNGKGIKENDILSSNSLGIMGMRERLHPFDGKLKLHGIPNRETTLVVILPIDGSQVKGDM